MGYDTMSRAVARPESILRASWKHHPAACVSYDGSVHRLARRLAAAWEQRAMSATASAS